MAEEILVVDLAEENAKAVLEVKEAVVLHQEEKAEEILAEEKVDSEATEDELLKEKADSEEKEVVLLQRREPGAFERAPRRSESSGDESRPKRPRRS